MKWLKKLNKRYVNMSVFVIITCVVIYILSRVADNIKPLTKSFLSACHWILSLLKPVVIGFAIAYLFFPLMRKIEGWLAKIKPLAKRKKTQRGLSVLILFLLAVGALVLIISAVVSSLTNHYQLAGIDDLIAAVKTALNSVSDLYSRVVKRLEEMHIGSEQLDNAIATVTSKFAGIVSKLSAGIITSVGGVKDILTTTLFSVIFGIYFLLDGENLMQYWRRVFHILLDGKAKSVTKQALKDMDQVFSGYIRGQIIDATLVGCLVTIAYSIIGVEYAALIGLLVGLGNLIPYLGPILGYGSTLLVGLAMGNWGKIIIAMIVLLVIQGLDGNVINPKLLSSQINVHPLLVVLSLIVGGRIGGLVGMLLAVPSGALVKIWFERFLSWLEIRKQQTASGTAPAEDGSSGESDTGPDTPQTPQ